MKHLLLSAAAFISFSANAQLEKRTWLLGGSASFNNEKRVREGETITTTNDFSISPNIGYFFADKFAGGLRTTFQTTNLKTPINDQTLRRLLIGPFVRYYFLQANKETNILSELSYERQFDLTPGIFAFNKWTLSAGPAIFLNDIVAIELIAFYSRLASPGDNDTYHSFGFTAGFQIHLSK